MNNPAPLLDIGTLAASILSGGGIVVSLIWKYAPRRNGNGHTKDIIAHDIDISHLKEDVGEIKHDVRQIWDYLRNSD